ncbi:MAG: hypothetical protein Q8L35_06610 [Actinomycetota bacterium]|nr:hypothetical protein [Actinomycetota bacterium]
MKNKLAVRDWHKIIKETRSEAEQALRITVVGEAAIIRGLQAFLGSGAETVFRPADEGEKTPSQPADLTVVAVSGNAPIGEGTQAAAKAGLRSGAEVIALIDESGLSPSARLAKLVEAELALDLSPGCIRFFSPGMDPAEKNALLRVITDAVGEKGLALAARAPAFRPVVVRRIINEIAGQNAIIGVAALIPAGDMPVLTANQIRMVLKIAAAFGATVSLKRAKELLVVVGGGFTFRAIARELVGLVPIAGWAVKGVVAYTGTRALGDLAVKYFAGLEESD